MPVFMAFIALFAIAAGWYVYKKVFDVPPVDLTQYDIGGGGQRTRMFNRPNQNNPNQKPVANAGIGVLKRNDGFDVQIPGARARFWNEGDTNLRVTVRLMNNNLFPQADQQAAAARWAAVNVRDAAKKANVTDEQLAKLKNIGVPREVPLTEDQLRKFMSAGERYKTAADDQKPAVESELTELLRSVASTAEAPTIAAYHNSAQAIRQVLDATQINTLRNTRN